MRSKVPTGPTLHEAMSSAARSLSWVKQVRLLETNWDRRSRRIFDPADLAELYHENSKMRPINGLQQMLSSDVFQQPVMLEATTGIGKRYPQFRHITLPDPVAPRSPLGEVILRRRSIRKFTGEPMSIQDLSSLLYFTNGITCRFDFKRPDTGAPLVHYFRASPSGGGLYPVEIYVCLVNVADTAPALCHYETREHSLAILDDSPGVVERTLRTFTAHPMFVRMDLASVVVLLTGVFERTYGKYGPRGYRYALQESGHIAQNVCLVSTALGYGSVAMAAFYDDEVNRLLGLDGVEEAVLYTLALGRSTEKVGRSVTPQNYEREVRTDEA